MKAPQHIRLFVLILLALVLPASWYLVRAGKASSRLPVARALLRAFTPPAPAQATPPNATIIRTIVYRQLTDFQNGGSVGAIHNLKISADGSKIIFLSGRKVFTIDATGQNLREIYDAPNPAADAAPNWVDISADGSKVLWAANTGPAIFTANADGTNLVRLAPAFPNQFGGNDVLELYLNPCLTADGSRVIFTQAGPVPDTAGGYRINSDGTGLTKLFSYRQMAALFGKDGSELNRNISFTAMGNSTW